MSELREAVLDAIDGGARDRAAIVEETGLEAIQVTNLLSALRMNGTIVKGDDGWARASSADPPPNGRVHKAVEPDAEPPAAALQKPAKKRKYTRKVNGANGAAHHALPVPASAAAPEAPPVSFARFGEYVVLKMDDLRDLAELVARFERWRPIAELVRGQ